MKKNSKLIKNRADSLDVAELTTRALNSLAMSLPLAYDPIKFLFAAGALFTSQSIVKMGSGVQDFLKSKKAKAEAERRVPYRKLYETLKFLHNSSALDDDFVDALRNLHILTFAQDVKTEEVAEIYILLETARKLSGPDVSILLATYRIKHGLYSPEKMAAIKEIANNNLNPNFANGWARMVAKAVGYSLPEYVESRQSHLEDLRLIVPRNHNQFSVDGRGNDFTPYEGSRLTDFGHKLTEYIVRGEEMFESASS